MSNDDAQRNERWLNAVGFRPRGVLTSEFKAEFNELTTPQAPRTGPRARVVKVDKVDLINLMRRAHDGTVRDEERAHKSEWEYPVGHWRNMVGELKHPVEPHRPPEEPQVRLYFGAPAEEPEALVWLMAATKSSSLIDRMWKSVQNNHIKEAARRLGVWRTSYAVGRFRPPR